MNEVWAPFWLMQSACAFVYAQGKDKYVVGNGLNVVDFTYVTNVAYAHLLAAVRLERDAKHAGEVRRVPTVVCVCAWYCTTPMSFAFPTSGLLHHQR